MSEAEIAFNLLYLLLLFGLIYPPQEFCSAGTFKGCLQYFCEYFLIS